MPGIDAIYRGGNRGAEAYMLGTVNFDSFEFLQGTCVRISTRLADEVGRSKIQGVTQDRTQLIVAGESKPSPAITLRHIRGAQFLRVFVTEEERSAIGKRFNLDLEKLAVVFRLVNNKRIAPSWHELFTPAFLRLYLEWLESPAALARRKVSFPWQTYSGGSMGFPHVPEICRPRVIGTAEMKGTAELGIWEGLPLFTFRWKSGEKERSLAYVRREGIFAPQEEMEVAASASGGHTPLFDAETFRSFFRSSCQEKRVEGFMQAGKGKNNFGALSFGQVGGELVRISGVHKKRITVDHWYWVAAENREDTVEVSIFTNRQDKTFYAKICFEKMKNPDGVAEPELRILEEDALDEEEL